MSEPCPRPPVAVNATVVPQSPHLLADPDGPSRNPFARLDETLDRTLRWRWLGVWRWVMLAFFVFGVVVAVGVGATTDSTYESPLGQAFGAFLGTFLGGSVLIVLPGALARRFGGKPMSRQERVAHRMTPGMHTCSYLGGAGMPFQPGTPYRFGVSHDQLLWLTLDGRVALAVPFSNVFDATVGGAGKVTTSGGFGGGGFGVAGAAEGMAAAAVLNALTTRTKVDSVLRVATTTSEGLFAFTAALPQDIDLELSRLRVALRQRAAVPAPRQPPPPPSAPPTLPPPPPLSAMVDTLERLAGLRDRGILSESEFQAQKQALLVGR